MQVRDSLFKKITLPGHDFLGDLADGPAPLLDGINHPSCVQDFRAKIVFGGFVAVPVFQHADVRRADAEPWDVMVFQADLVIAFGEFDDYVRLNVLIFIGCKLAARMWIESRNKEDGVLDVIECFASLLDDLGQAIVLEVVQMLLNQEARKVVPIVILNLEEQAFLDVPESNPVGFE